MSYQIRPFNRSDYEELFHLLSHPSSYKYQSWKITTFEEAVKFLDTMDQMREGLKYLVLEINNEIIGACLLQLNLKHHEGEIGYIVSHEQCGKGLATYMANYLLDLGFNTYQLNRIFASTDVENIASYKVMKKIGMTREGLLRQNKRINDSYRDSYIYSILRLEYQNG